MWGSEDNFKESVVSLHHKIPAEVIGVMTKAFTHQASSRAPNEQVLISGLARKVSESLRTQVSEQEAESKD